MKCRNCKHPRWAEEYPGRPFFGWCDEINDSPDLDIERECRCFEPATNADRIRSMSDDELASALVRYEGSEKRPTPYGGHEHKFYGPNGEECGTREYAVQLWTDWLRQPAEED